MSDQNPPIPHAYLLLVLLCAGAAACSGDDNITVPPTTASVEITTSTSGTEPDPDGYTVQMDAEPAQAIEISGTINHTEITPGAHTVQLAGMAGNCSVVGENPRSVTVAAGETATVAFVVACGATTGGLQVTSSTSGPSTDPDGYTLTVDGTERGTLGGSGNLTLEGLSPGEHVIGLSGVAANCRVEGDNPRTVTIAAGENPAATFAVTCAAPPANAGTLRVTTSSTGPDQDPDGYTFSVDGGRSQPIGVSATANLANVAAGTHRVRLSGLADNCQVQGENPRPVTLTAGATADVSFAITCNATTGTIEVSVATSGSPVDPDGYTIRLDSREPGAFIAATGSATLDGVPAGRHSVELTGVASNCTVDQGATREVTVSVGKAVELSFTVTCTDSPPTTGEIEITTRTVGDDLDADGYIVSVDGGEGQPIGVNATLTISAAPGVHSVELGGLAANCLIQGPAVQHVRVPARGGRPAITFAVRCPAVVSGYQATDLGTLGGASSIANGINIRGTIVGMSDGPSGTHAFLWENGRMTDLGPQGTFSLAVGINSAGQVAGSSATSQVFRAFRWENGTMTDLGPGQAGGINEAGAVAGVQGNAVVWANGEVTQLGSLGGESFATSLNDRGQVVGASRTAATGIHHAFLWADGVMTDLGTLGGTFSEATGINASGQVVGTSSTATGGNRAFLWTNGVMIDLGTLGGGSSRAYGINSRGQVVGASETTYGEEHAFIWENGVMTDLGTLGGGGSEARAINDEGEVVGSSGTQLGESHATLWEPK